jgi:hypothetical protein
MGDGFAEEDETLGVVGVIQAAFLVDVASLEELRLLDEINGEALVHGADPDPALDAMGAEGQIQAPIDRLNIGKLHTQAAIKGRDETDLVAGARQEFGQRPDHVRQAACFGVRKGLAAREQNIHH